MGIFYDRMLTTLKIHGMSESTMKNNLAEMKKVVKHFITSPDKLTTDHIYLTCL